MATELVYDGTQVHWDAPGKRHYNLAFHLDSSWGYSLVPLTVINGLRRTVDGAQPAGVAVFGGTHGNEWEGQIATKRLCRDLNPDEICGRVILMPQLSVSACAANARLSPLDNVKLNRAFPGSARGSISYRIAHFVKSHVFPLVRVVTDLHSGGVEGGFALCASIHSVPDPKQYEEMVSAAKLFDTSFVFIYSSQMASGLLSDEAEAEGKIAIGGEFGYGESVSRKGVLHAYEGVKNLLRRYGHLQESVKRIRRLNRVLGLERCARIGVAIRRLIVANPGALTGQSYSPIFRQRPRFVTFVPRLATALFSRLTENSLLDLRLVGRTSTGSGETRKL